MSLWLCYRCLLELFELSSAGLEEPTSYAKCHKIKNCRVFLTTKVRSRQENDILSPTTIRNQILPPTELASISYPSKALANQSRQATREKLCETMVQRVQRAMPRILAHGNTKTRGQTYTVKPLSVKYYYEMVSFSNKLNTSWNHQGRVSVRDYPH